MRVLRFDSVGGASGDMILGALAEIGCDWAPIAITLHAVLPEILGISCEMAESHGLRGSRARVRIGATGDHPPHPPLWPDATPEAPARDAAGPAQDAGKPKKNGHFHRTLHDIEALLAAPALTGRPRRLAAAIFDKLATVEAGIHGKSKKTLHFHEVGAADAVADIVGACLALEQLGIEAVQVGPLPCGVGTIACAHGVMPNPAPATLRLLEGMETLPTDEPYELVTPTGAAILSVWAEMLGNFNGSARLVRSGFGFGHRTLNGRPNVLRATMLDTAEPSGARDTAGVDALCVIETNLDDCNPQWIGDLIGRLLEAGARDAWATPVTMKKNRPGFVVSALAAAADVVALENIVFQATTTFGIRRHAVTRTELDRRFETVATPWGEVRVKIGSRCGRDSVRMPEFEDCARLARVAGVMPRQVYEFALQLVTQ